MKKYGCLWLFAWCIASLFAQQSRTLEAVRMETGPLIDGDLTDACWQQLAPLEDFISSTPVFGQTPPSRTEVRVFYTETVLFVSAYCFVPDGDRVRNDGSARDGERTGDWFQIGLDTWNDDQLAFDFSVSAAGDQWDARQGDAQWNARWASAVRRTVDGWAVEIAIPFSALRYSPQAEQQWGLQFTRFDRASGETSTWNPQDPLIADNVLQFGTLTGIRDIRQISRDQLSIHAASVVSTEGAPFNQRSFQQTLGMDGRVGVNESTSLDFSFLPPGGYYAVLKTSPFRDKESDFFWNATLPGPRPLQTEESGLFQRGTYLSYTPVIYSNDVRWRLDSLTPFAFVDRSESNLLNSIKLTTRTPGPWRLGMYNALLGGIDAKIRNLFNGTERTERLQGMSNYNYLDAEYLLPNTGFIHVSNATFLGGSDFYSWMPGLSFRLRDPGNSYQATGTLLVSHARADTVSRTGGSYFLSLGRVNKSWGWEVLHSGQTQRYQSAPVPYTNDVDARSDQTQAGITYRDFSPHRKFLNRSGAIGLNTRWGVRTGGQNIWNLFVRVSGLDHRFRRHTVEITAVPHQQLVRYTSGGAYLNQKLAPRFGSKVAFTTDRRRRLIWTGIAGGSISTRGELPEVVVQTEALWALGRRFTLRLSGRKTGTLDQLYLLNTPGEWLFEERNTWVGQDRLGIDWFPVDRSRVFLELGVNTYRFEKRRAVKLVLDGRLTPVNQELPVLESSTNWSGAFGIQYFFNDISEIRLTHTVNPTPGAYNLAPAVYSIDLRNLTELRFVYVIGGGRYR